MGEDGGSADVQKLLMHRTFIKHAFVNSLKEIFLGVFLLHWYLIVAEPLFLT